jgi:hypothetical protein
VSRRIIVIYLANEWTLRDWIKTVVDLIGVRKKSKNILYKEMKKKIFCSDFFYLNSNKKLLM